MSSSEKYMPCVGLSKRHQNASFTPAPHPKKCFHIPLEMQSLCLLLCFLACIKYQQYALTGSGWGRGAWGSSDLPNYKNYGYASELYILYLLDTPFQGERCNTPSYNIPGCASERYNLYLLDTPFYARINNYWQFTFPIKWDYRAETLYSIIWHHSLHLLSCNFLLCLFTAYR